MTFQTSIDLDTAGVHPNAPSFATLIERLSGASKLSPRRRRDLISGLRRLAKALGYSIEDVHADPRWLRPRIAKVAPAAVGLSTKSWTNVQSDARAAMAQCGIVKAQRRRAGDLSPAWHPLWDDVLASRDLSLRAALGRFVHFLDRIGVGPEDVDETYALAYCEALERNEISKDPETTWRAAVNGWNRAEARLTNWPRRRLTLPSRSRPIGLPLSTFPPSLLADLDYYIDQLRNPDPLDVNAPLRGMRPSSLKLRRVELIRFAAVLVRSGVPAESLTDLAAMVEPEQVKRGLQWLLDRTNQHKTDGTNQRITLGIARMAETLRQVACRHVRVPAPVQAQLDRLARRLDLAAPKQKGMTEKNRKRLRQLDDDAALRRFIQLPKRLMAAADAKGSSYTAHLLREDAVAIAILLTCPIRVGNLNRIHLERHLERPGGGGVFVVFEPEEVKNGHRIDFKLPQKVVDLIDRHLALRSPLLCPPGTPWLFPKRDGSAPMVETQLSRKVCESIHREAGIVMNVHLFRHVAAKLWLQDHPGQYDELRLILGHKRLSSTLEVYTGFEAGPAVERLGKVLADRMSK